ncbi:methyltransferase-like protein 22 isoform X2 [Dipodomys merriami]|uniref:methyltransferase-like protein 22 isoform X2 n=1 Tax=Dipodomys merriami TaxID=94247 RepID=UPI003855BB96
MDEVSFRSDTVLSDVHLYTPNHRHLMVRLNSVGQPVFLSQFKLLWSPDSGSESARYGDVPTREPPPPGPGSPGSPPRSSHVGESVALQAGQEGLGAQLDEDGDLDVVRRPQATSEPDPAEPPRDKVHPMILTQEEAGVPGPEGPESGPHSIIQIGVAGRPVPGRLHPVPTGPLPRVHSAGARGGHGPGQHRGRHSGEDSVLHRCWRRPSDHVPAKRRPQQPPGSRWRWSGEGQRAGLAEGRPLHRSRGALQLVRGGHRRPVQPHHGPVRRRSVLRRRPDGRAVSHALPTGAQTEERLHGHPVGGEEAQLHSETPGHHLRSLRPLPLLPAGAGEAGGGPAALRGGARGGVLPAAAHL